MLRPYISLPLLIVSVALPLGSGLIRDLRRLGVFLELGLAGVILVMVIVIAALYEIALADKL